MLISDCFKYGVLILQRFGDILTKNKINDILRYVLENPLKNETQNECSKKGWRSNVQDNTKKKTSYKVYKTPTRWHTTKNIACISPAKNVCLEKAKDELNIWH